MTDQPPITRLTELRPEYRELVRNTIIKYGSAESGGPWPAIICARINQEFAAPLNLQLTPNAVRLILRRARQKGAQVPAEGTCAATVTLEPGEEAVVPVVVEPSEKEIVQIVRLEKTATRLHANFNILQRKYARLLKTADLTAAIRATVQEHIEALPPVPPPKLWTPASDRHLTHETWGVMFSDLHWGEQIRATEVMRLNSYDKDIATRRVELFVEVQADLVLNHLQGYHFEDGFIWSLGDDVSGDIHDELSLTNIGPTFDHIFEVALIKTQMIREMLTFLPRVVVRITDDNHGRWLKKKTAKRRYVNHSMEIGHILSGLFRDEPRVEFRIEESAFTIDDVRGHRFLSMHGDTFRAWNQIPDYGIERGDMRLSQLLSAHGKAYEYFLLAHFHTSGSRARAGGRRMMNGCIKGGDEYAMTVLHTGGAPEQTVFGIHPKWGKTFHYDIDLSTPHDAKPKRWTYDFRPTLGIAHERAVETTEDWAAYHDAPRADTPFWKPEAR